MSDRETVENELAYVTDQRNRSLTRYKHHKSIQAIIVSGKRVTHQDTAKALRNAKLILAHAECLHSWQNELRALQDALSELDLTENS